jgi:hypothetical protein
MNRFSIIIIYLLCQHIAYSQKLTWKEYFGRELTLGLGGLVSGDQDEMGKVFWDFYLINAKLEISVGRRSSVGLRQYTIWEAPVGEDRQRFAVRGLYYQWAYIKRDWVNLWVEGGYYFGNYCPCGISIAFNRPGTALPMIGGGADIRLFDRFYLEFSARHGVHIPAIPNVRFGDFGILAHAGINYRLRVR